MTAILLRMNSFNTQVIVTQEHFDTNGKWRSEMVADCKLSAAPMASNKASLTQLYTHVLHFKYNYILLCIIN